ncbi:NAD-dependent epimerase/dehydratase family protein [bacterium]|nr:MAG: NAD-dependent epimerase/dehydratase family protein [bacterium]
MRGEMFITHFFYLSIFLIQAPSYYLVTGAAGSIGRLFVEAILQTHSEAIVIGLDNDDTDLYELDELYKESNRFIPTLGDIADVDYLKTLFNTYPISTVVHAAAHKQVSLLERFPERAFRINTISSIELLELSEKNKAQFLFISSDKAVEPTGVLGLSKWLVELYISLTHSHASVFRLPNIIGSRGSFFSEWEKIYMQKGFIPITDVNSTRFVISIDDLYSCILDWLLDFSEVTSSLITPSHIEEVKLIDFIHEQLDTKNMSRDIVTITGLRDGEKSTEKMYWGCELKNQKRNNELIIQDFSCLNTSPWLAFSGYPDKFNELDYKLFLQTIYYQSLEQLKTTVSYE